MNIVMVTNTYTPHIGGVARSVEAFSSEFRRNGHRVLIVAPEFSNLPTDEVDVVRIPAIQNFNGSDFSVALPTAGLLTESLDKFQPEIVHAHHPYLLGMTALRIARYRELPLVFTHHTLYEQYTHYVPVDSPIFRQFVIELATHYANLTDQVFAPSESIASLIQDRGVKASIAVVPTGVNLERFRCGEGQHFRASMGISKEAFVVGHVGRLAPEKNLGFLAESVAKFLHTCPLGHFLIVGQGPSKIEIRDIFERQGLMERLHVAGALDQNELADAYHAMDVFAFASKSETQGMVLTEAMAASVPIVALDASGVREVVKDGFNGRLLHEETPEVFSTTLQWLANLPAEKLESLKRSARETAETFSMQKTAAKAIAHYEALHEKAFVHRHDEFDQWQRILSLIKAEWDIVKGMTEAVGSAMSAAEPHVKSENNRTTT
jgi:glycosyltransferase involved in cell wall biosynthesis